MEYEWYGATDAQLLQPRSTGSAWRSAWGLVHVHVKCVLPSEQPAACIRSTIQTGAVMTPCRASVGVTSPAFPAPSPRTQHHLRVVPYTQASNAQAAIHNDSGGAPRQRQHVNMVTRPGLLPEPCLLLQRSHKVRHMHEQGILHNLLRHSRQGNQEKVSGQQAYLDSGQCATSVTWAGIHQGCLCSVHDQKLHLTADSEADD
jgi:hypothetical protein